MKKINLIQIVFIFVLMNLCKNGYAQFIAGGNYIENFASVSSVYPSNTGNDILQIGSDVFSVSVCSDAGTNPTISWEVFYSGTYTGRSALSYTSNIYHADVCLVVDQGNNDICAVVAWHAAVGGGADAYYVDLFTWNNANAFVAQGATMLANGMYGTSLNIDGDDNGNFVVIYDDNSQNIMAFTGSVVSGAFALNNSGNAVTFNNTGVYPDACLYYSGSGERVHATYIKPNGDLRVEDHTFSVLAGGSPNVLGTPIAGQAPAGNYVFSYPRIACPNSNGNIDDWTVVADYDDRTNNPNRYKIVGYNYKNGTGLSSMRIYNDGTYISGIDLTLAPNFLPVVAYDDNYTTDGIWVGWNMDNSAPTYTAGAPDNYTNIVDALYPIVLKCNNVAALASGITDYWQVPNSLGSGDQVNLLSLAGRYGTDRLYLTYYDVNSSADIWTKEATSASATIQLRTINTNGINEFIDQANKSSLNNSDAKVTIKIFDLNGNLILNENGELAKIREVLMLNAENIPAAVYLAQIISDDGYYLSKKIFIGN